MRFYGSPSWASIVAAWTFSRGRATLAPIDAGMFTLAIALGASILLGEFVHHATPAGPYIGHVAQCSFWLTVAAWLGGAAILERMSRGVRVRAVVVYGITTLSLAWFFFVSTVASIL